MSDTPAIKTRAYRVVDGATGRLISWCLTRADADKAVARWARRCARRARENLARVERVEAGKP